AQNAGSPYSHSASTAVAKADSAGDPPSAKVSGKSFAVSQTIKLSDAVPIPKLRKGAETLAFAYKIEAPHAARTLYFGELTNSDELTLPLVIIGGGGKLKAVR